MSMEINDKLRVLVEAEVEKAIKDMEKFDKAIGNAEKSAGKLGDALDSIAKKSMVLSAAIAAAGIAAVKFAGENEQLKLSLQNMLGSAEEASIVFEEWRRLGSSPGLSADEVFSLGRAMVNMGQDTQYVTQTIKMLGDVAAGTGVSFGEISGSFEHARAMGNLTTRDLVRLQQQGIPIVKQFAKELGISEEGVRRLADEGKIGFADLERALRSMTTPGGQFAGMMDELSGTVLEKFSTAADDAKQALASFGELLLPVATEMLDDASFILRGITDMDEGTKRFVLGMGGVVAVSGPAILAIKGIGAAMTAVAANPYILAVGGVIAGVGIITGLINKQAHAYDDLQAEIKKTDMAAKGLLSSYADGNEEKILDEKTTRELIKLYPELTDKIKANTVTVREAAEAAAESNKKRVIDGQASQIRQMEEYQQRLIMAMANVKDMYESIEMMKSRGMATDAMEHNLQVLLAVQDEYFRKATEQRDAINAVFASIGKELLFDGNIRDIPVRANITIDESSLEPPPPDPELKKRWQYWFGEITKIDPSLIVGSENKRAGTVAAELYLADFERAFTAKSIIADALGEQLDIASVLKSQQADIQKVLVELFSIDPNQIDSPFGLIDHSVTPLIAEFKRLGKEIEEAETIMKTAATEEEYTKHIEKLRKKIEDFGKSENQLAYEAIAVDEAFLGQAEEVKNLMDQYTRMEVLDGYQGYIDAFGVSLDEFSLAIREAAEGTDSFQELIEKFDGLVAAEEATKKLKETLDGLGDSVKNLAFSSALSGIEALGHAFGMGADAGDAMKSAVVSMAQEILNALPNLFLQAGLQLVGQPGMLGLGLGFIAAAGSAALIKGYVDGRVEDEQSAARNAHGNIFDAAGVMQYAHGGAFTNQIVNTPTYFRHGGGLGLMGEAGPEAIVPLRRMANGDLGIASDSSGSTQVTVNIINNSSAEVQQNEQTDSNGNKQIDVIIGSLVNNHLASGKADRVMGSRYGLRAAGV